VWLCCAFSAAADDTIITWTDPEIGTDIALSFQVRQLATRPAAMYGSTLFATRCMAGD
jgi:hypothetical protein